MFAGAKRDDLRLSVNLILQTMFNWRPEFSSMSSQDAVRAKEEIALFVAQIKTHIIRLGQYVDSTCVATRSDVDYVEALQLMTVRVLASGLRLPAQNWFLTSLLSFSRHQIPTKMVRIHRWFVETLHQKSMDPDADRVLCNQLYEQTQPAGAYLLPRSQRHTLYRIFKTRVRGNLLSWCSRDDGHFLTALQRLCPRFQMSQKRSEFKSQLKSKAASMLKKELRQNPEENQEDVWRRVMVAALNSRPFAVSIEWQDLECNAPLIQYLRETHPLDNGDDENDDKELPDAQPARGNMDSDSYDDADGNDRQEEARKGKRIGGASDDPPPKRPARRR